MPNAPATRTLCVEYWRGKAQHPPGVFFQVEGIAFLGNAAKFSAKFRWRGDRCRGVRFEFAIQHGFLQCGGRVRKQYFAGGARVQSIASADSPPVL